MLNVAVNATKAEIKKAYKKLASKYHPDREGGDTKKFQEITHAYEILSDDERRERYDLSGDETEGPDPYEMAVLSLSEIFIEIAEAQGFKKKNYIPEIQQAIKDGIKKLSRDKKKLGKKLKMAEYLRDKIDSKGKLFEAMHMQVNKVKIPLAELEFNLKIGEITLEILKSCTYTGEIELEAGRDSRQNPFDRLNEMGLGEFLRNHT